MRNNKVCAHVHYSICKGLCIQATNKWYAHTPKPVCEHEDVTVLQNQGLHTEKANRKTKKRKHAY